MKKGKFVDCIILPKKRQSSLKRSCQKKGIFKKLVISEKEENFGLNLFFKNFWDKIFNAFGEFKLTLSYIFKLLLVSKIGLILVLITLVVPLTAFEAHVVNVTATIERKPCLTYEIRSMGYWKNHPDQRIFSQTIGNATVANNTEADAVFALSNNSMANKLRKQLLTLKFDIVYFDSGNAIVGGGNSTTFSELAAQADEALLADPQNPDQISHFHNLIEGIVTKETVSTCEVCPKGKEVYWYNFNVNQADPVIYDLRGNINHSDHVRASFRINPACADIQLSLVSYKAPSDIFNENTAGEQIVFAQQTGTFSGGTSTYSLEVDVPACYFQIDFAKGPVIEHLGPAGSDNFYSAQGRLISADNGDPDGPSCNPSLDNRNNNLGGEAGSSSTELSEGLDLNNLKAGILDIIQPFIEDEEDLAPNDASISTTTTSTTVINESSEATTTISEIPTGIPSPVLDSNPASSTPDSISTPPSTDSAPSSAVTEPVPPVPDPISSPPTETTPPPVSEPSPTS